MGFYTLHLKDGKKDAGAGSDDYVNSCSRIHVRAPNFLEALAEPSIAKLRKIAAGTHGVNDRTGRLYVIPSDARRRKFKNVFVADDADGEYNETDAADELEKILQSFGLKKTNFDATYLKLNETS